MNVNPPPGQLAGLVTSDQQGPWLTAKQDGQGVLVTPPVAARCWVTVHCAWPPTSISGWVMHVGGAPGAMVPANKSDDVTWSPPPSDFAVAPPHPPRTRARRPTENVRARMMSAILKEKRRRSR